MTVPAFLHVGTRSQHVAEAALWAGYDGLVLDLQHGELDLGTTQVLLRSVPDPLDRTLVRVPSIEPGVIGTVLVRFSPRPTAAGLRLSFLWIGTVGLRVT